MNKRLRLLVTSKCHNDCPLCCNKQFDLETLPIVNRWDYDEIILTGGEPLSSNKNVRNLIKLIRSIKVIQKIQGLPVSKFYLYTSTHHIEMLLKMLKYLDGVTYTPHNNEEKLTLLNFTNILEQEPNLYEGKSLRLNLFPEDYQEIMQIEVIRKFWNLKKIKWLKECPVPDGEVFERIYDMY